MMLESKNFSNILEVALNDYRNSGVLAIDLSHYDINAVDKQGNTALHITLSKYNQCHEQEDLSCYRSNKAATSVKQKIIEKLKNKKKEEEFDKYTDFLLKQEKFYDAILKILLKNGADIAIANDRGETPLHLAARSGSTLLVKTLLGIINASNQIAIYSRDLQGNTPLHSACHGYYQFSPYYGLENPAQNTTGLQASDTKILQVLEASYCQIIDELIKNGADVHSKNKYQETPLHIAFKESRNIAIINHLLSKGADLLDVDVDLNTVLHIVLSRQANTYLLSKFLLERKGSMHLINFANRYGLYPLHVLSIKEGIERANICKLLLAHPQTDLNIINSELETPLFYAVQSADEELTKILLQKNADVNHRNIRKETPLLCALQQHIASGNNPTKQENLSKVIKCLLEYGANPDVECSSLVFNKIDNKNIKNWFAEAQEKITRKNSNAAVNRNSKSFDFQREVRQAMEITLKNIQQLEIAHAHIIANPHKIKSQQFYELIYKRYYITYNDFIKQLENNNNDVIDMNSIAQEIKLAKDEKYKIGSQLVSLIANQWQLLLQLKSTYSSVEINFSVINSAIEKIKIFIQQYKAIVNHEQFFESIRYLADKNRVVYAQCVIELASSSEPDSFKQIEKQIMIDAQQFFKTKTIVQNQIESYQEEQLFCLVKLLYDLTLNQLSLDKTDLEVILNNIANDVHADFRQLFCSSQPEEVLKHRDKRISQQKLLENKQVLLNNQSKLPTVFKSKLEYIDNNNAIAKQTRAHKNRTIVNNTYQLIHEITVEEARELMLQTGIKWKFNEGETSKEIFFKAGQYGVVGLARKVTTNSQGMVIEREEFIAVKEIEGHEKIQASQSEALLQFLLQARLKKPSYIMPLYDSVEEKGSEQQPVLYQFMPLAGFGDGEVFQQKLHALNDEILFQHLTIYFAKVLLTAVANMHKNKIYHLDIKPSNIIFDLQGNAYLIDFGCAQHSAKGEIFQQENGDKNYYSPERLAYYRYLWLQAGHSFTTNEVEQNYDAAKVDAWAVGMTLLEILSNSYPLERSDYTNKLELWDKAYYQQKIIPAISNLAKTSDSGLVPMIKNLLEIDPKKRLSIEKALADPIFSSNEMNQLFYSANARKVAFQQLNADSLKRNQVNNQNSFVFTTDSSHQPRLLNNALATDYNPVIDNMAKKNDNGHPIQYSNLVDFPSTSNPNTFFRNPTSSSTNRQASQATNYGSLPGADKVYQNEIDHLRELITQSSRHFVDSNNIHLKFTDKTVAENFYSLLCSHHSQVEEDLTSSIKFFTTDTESNNTVYIVHLTKDKYDQLESEQMFRNNRI